MTRPLVLFGAAGSVGSRIEKRLRERFDILSVDVDGGVDAADGGALLALRESLPPRCIAINAAGVVTTADDPGSGGALVRSNVQAPYLIAKVLGDRLERLIHISSVSVYGRPDPFHQLIKEDRPLKPVTSYGVSKLAAEELLRIEFSERRCDLTILRSTQLFGLESAADTLPHILVRGLLSGESPQLDAAPSSRRDYLHVDDLVSLVAATAEDPQHGVFNAGARESVELGRLFEVAYMAAGREPPLLRGGPDASQVLDSSLARATFRWEPSRPVMSWLADRISSGVN